MFRVMNTERHRELVQLLTAYDLKGVSFYTAKQELLAKGYSETEISHALFEANFDGKKNEPKPQSEHAKIMADNPVLAQKVADTLIAVDYEKQWSKDKARMLSHAGTRLMLGGNMRMPMLAESNTLFFGGLGFLFFLVVAALVSSAKGWSSEWLEWLQFIFSTVFIILLVVHLIRRMLHLHHLRKQQKSERNNK